jgi:hypothetical protein
MQVFIAGYRAKRILKVLNLNYVEFAPYVSGRPLNYVKLLEGLERQKQKGASPATRAKRLRKLLGEDLA